MERPTRCGACTNVCGLTCSRAAALHAGPNCSRVSTSTRVLLDTSNMARTRGAELLSRIHEHKGVIGYIEHGKIEGQLYLLMEYVEAENLKDLYARHDPVLVENVAQILIDM